MISEHQVKVVRWLIGVVVVALVATGALAWWRQDEATHIPAQLSEQLSELPQALETLVAEDRCEATFAVIGDYGQAGPHEAAVAALVRGWQPDFIATVGDNNYPDGAAETIDENIGQYFHDYIYPYQGSFGAGAAVNRFFPALGNHDWHTRGAKPYVDYFTLPGNERYYDVAWGPVHLFVLDSNSPEPDGISATSVQAQWLKEKLAASTAPWKLVVLHHAPYSSSTNHGSTAVMQWPYEAWGADAVLAGHDHIYERLQIGGIPYFVNGLGGGAVYGLGKPIAGSQVLHGFERGAMKVIATPERITYSFETTSGEVIDTHIVEQTAVGSCAPIPGL